MKRFAAAALLLLGATFCRAQIVQVFPESPAASEPFVIEVILTAPNTPPRIVQSNVWILDKLIRADLVLNSDGASVPGNIRYTRVMDGLPTGVYTLVVNVQQEGLAPVTTRVVGVNIAPAAVPASPAYRNLSGVWFSPDEPGWGVNIVQGESGQLFAFWLTYRADDQPPSLGFESSWFHMSNGIWASPTEFRGLLLETFGPSAAKPFSSSPVTVNGAGNASFRFINDHEVEFTAHAGTLSAPLFAKQKTLQRFAF
jgi:hypothetical protein